MNLKRQSSKTAKLIFSKPDASGNSFIKVIAEETTSVELEIGIEHDMTLRWIMDILDENHISLPRRQRVFH